LTNIRSLLLQLICFADTDGYLHRRTKPDGGESSKRRMKRLIPTKANTGESDDTGDGEAMIPTPAKGPTSIFCIALITIARYSFMAHPTPAKGAKNLQQTL
jgi:hypothetical protein